MADTNFWSGPATEPKRNFRWVLTMGSSEGEDISEWMIKTVKKPSFTVSNVQHQFVAHTFNFPGRIQWDPIEVTLVDPVTPNAAAILTKNLESAGYTVPSDIASAKRSFSRPKALAAWGSPVITQINADGATIDKWKIYNAWCERVDFGLLDYASEEITVVSLTFRYDYASFAEEGKNWRFGAG